jgi:hypothetical protein
LELVENRSAARNIQSWRRAYVTLRSAIVKASDPLAWMVPDG